LIASFETVIQEHAWRDPAVTELTLRMAKIEDAIDAEHRRLADTQYEQYGVGTRSRLTRLFSVRQRLENLERYVETISSGLSRIRGTIASFPEYKSRLEELTREVEVAQSLRDRVRSQQESFEMMQEILKESRFRINEEAHVEMTPVWPDRRVILIAGIFAGLLMGGAAVVVLEFSDRSLKNAEETEAVLGFPVVGVVPRVVDLNKRA
jgi:uncharacterized protein involved in exopolysaccharide biosynthesis